MTTVRIFNNANDTEWSEELPDGTFTVGREEDNDIVLESSFVSRTHATVHRENSGYSIKAEGLNSTYINGTEIPKNEPTSFETGDEIQIGEFSLFIGDAVQGSETSGATESESGEKAKNELLADLKEEIHSRLLKNIDMTRLSEGSVTDEKQKRVENVLSSILSNIVTKIPDLLRDYIVRRAIRNVAFRQVMSQSSLQSIDYRSNQDIVERKYRKIKNQIVDDIFDRLGIEQRSDTKTSDLNKLEDSFDDVYKTIRDKIATGMREYLIKWYLKKQLMDMIFGLGPIQDLINMPNITEIMVVSRDRIYVERAGCIERVNRNFHSDDEIINVIKRIISPLGRKIDRSRPMVDARLPDGSRVNAIIPPLALDGPCLTIRKFSEDPFTVDDLIGFGTLNEDIAEFCKSCVKGRKNIVISGGTASGKTTFLNVLSSFIPGVERIITIEDSAELQLSQEHTVRLETKPPNPEGEGEYTMRDLVINALRMRPDRIIVGECRGDEILDMLQAMNTGHDGSLTTIHANSPQDLMTRIESMVLAAADIPVSAIREQVTSALDLVVQLNRLKDGQRVVTHVSEVSGLDANGNYRLDDVFVRSDEQFIHTGIIPSFLPDLIENDLFSLDNFLGVSSQ